jgi:hypothetical protein
VEAEGVHDSSRVAGLAMAARLDEPRAIIKEAQCGCEHAALVGA